MVRDFVKWDDTPASLEHFAEFRGARLQDCHDAADGADPAHPRQRDAGPAAARARKKPAIPKLSRMAPVAGDQNALAEVAQMLVNAENPVIVADRNTRTQAGIDRLVELAETLHVPVCDTGGRMNFPTAAQIQS